MALSKEEEVEIYLVILTKAMDMKAAAEKLKVKSLDFMMEAPLGLDGWDIRLTVAAPGIMKHIPKDDRISSEEFRNF